MAGAVHRGEQQRPVVEESGVDLEVAVRKAHHLSGLDRQDPVQPVQPPTGGPGQRRGSGRRIARRGRRARGRRPVRGALRGTAARVLGGRCGKGARGVALGQPAYDVDHGRVDHPGQWSAPGRLSAGHQVVQRAGPQAVEPLLGVLDGAVRGPDDPGPHRKHERGLLDPPAGRHRGGHQRQEGAVAPRSAGAATFRGGAEGVDAEPVDARGRDRQQRARQPDGEGCRLAGLQRVEVVEGAGLGDPVTDVGVDRGLCRRGELGRGGDRGRAEEALHVDRRPLLVGVVGDGALDGDRAVVGDVVGRDRAHAQHQRLRRVGRAGARGMRRGGGHARGRTQRDEHPDAQRCQGARQRRRAEHAPTVVPGLWRPGLAAHH